MHQFKEYRQQIRSAMNRDIAEGLKKVHTHSEGGHTATVHKDSDYGEFRVRLNGNAKTDAFESDKGAAIDTAQAMVRHAIKHSKTNKS